MHLTKLSLALIRIAITLTTTYILFSYGITQSLVTLGRVGDMSGWKLFTAAMLIVAYWGVGQVQREIKDRRTSHDSGMKIPRVGMVLNTAKLPKICEMNFSAPIA